MTLKAASPPLHRRHKSSNARKAVTRRYQVFKTKLGPQVKCLQRSGLFKVQCAELYGRGYKDWMILGAICNRILQKQMEDREINPQDREKAEAFVRDFMSNVEPITDIYDANHFCGPEFIFFLQQFNIIALKSYGFDIRGHILHAAVVETFLRQRLNYFEMDLPHRPLFGKQAGSWPSIQRK